jgi:transposase InsO family protein
MFPQADAEFDRCLKRRGKHWRRSWTRSRPLAICRRSTTIRVASAKGLKTGFAESYRAYLSLRGESNDDALLPDVRRRAGR